MQGVPVKVPQTRGELQSAYFVGSIEKSCLCSNMQEETGNIKVLLLIRSSKSLGHVLRSHVLCTFA